MRLGKLLSTGEVVDAAAITPPEEPVLAEPVEEVAVECPEPLVPADR